MFQLNYIACNRSSVELNDTRKDSRSPNDNNNALVIGKKARLLPRAFRIRDSNNLVTFNNRVNNNGFMSRGTVWKI